MSLYPCLYFCGKVNFGWDGLLEELEQIAELLRARAMGHMVIRLELNIVLVFLKQLH